MKINIRRRGKKTAILISFDTKTESFDSASEKSKFFEELYGRNQVIRRQKKVYRYHRIGLLDEVPSIKVDNSVFIVAMQHMQQMMNFFREWEEKVTFKTFPVLLDKEEIKKLEEKNE